MPPIPPSGIGGVFSEVLDVLEHSLRAQVCDTAPATMHSSTGSREAMTSYLHFDLQIFVPDALLMLHSTRHESNQRTRVPMRTSSVRLRRSESFCEACGIAKNLAR